MTRLDPNDDELTRRLGDALSADDRRHSLPADFATSVSETLPERAPRSWWSLATAPSVAATVVVAVAAVALVLAISPRLIGPAPGSSSAPSPSSPSESRGAGLAHYDHDGISFDYPTDWRVIEEGITARHYQWIPVVIGTGGWTLNCQAIPPSGDSLGGVTCGQDIFTVDAGEVVVEIYTWQGPGGPIQTAPPSATQLPSGWPATREDGADTSVWQIYLPGWLKPLTVEAHFDAAIADSARADVLALVESLVVSPKLSASPTAEASPQTLTEAEAVEAALNADGRPGMSAANVQSGPASQVLPGEGFEWADVPSGDTWVWLIVVSDDGPPLGQEGSFVVLDYFDGTIYGIQRWIS